MMESEYLFEDYLEDRAKKDTKFVKPILNEQVEEEDEKSDIDQEN